MKLLTITPILIATAAVALTPVAARAAASDYRAPAKATEPAPTPKLVTEYRAAYELSWKRCDWVLLTRYRYGRWKTIWFKSIGPHFAHTDPEFPIVPSHLFPRPFPVIIVFSALTTDNWFELIDWWNQWAHPR